jgi:hypothetical protein
MLELKLGSIRLENQLEFEAYSYTLETKDHF